MIKEEQKWISIEELDLTKVYETLFEIKFEDGETKTARFDSTIASINRNFAGFSISPYLIIEKDSTYWRNLRGYEPKYWRMLE
jgi:hypothetical protein